MIPKELFEFFSKRNGNFLPITLPDRSKAHAHFFLFVLKEIP
jgi:hypothetical protein